MRRPYFRFHRGLIKELCRIAHRCLADFQRTTLGLPDGTTGVVMAIHTFGEYLDFHPHLHALAADGLMVDSGFFHVMPDVSLAPLGELFRVRDHHVSGEKGTPAAGTRPDAARMDAFRVQPPPQPARAAPLLHIRAGCLPLLGSSPASRSTSDCGKSACGSMPPATRPNPLSRSLNPCSTIHSPTATTNWCLRETDNPASGKARPEPQNGGRLTLKAPSGSVRVWKSPLPASNSGPTSWRAESDFLSGLSDQLSFSKRDTADGNRAVDRHAGGRRLCPQASGSAQAWRRV